MMLVEFDFTDEERKKEKKRHNKRRKYLMSKRRKKYKWNYCHHWNVVGFMKVID